MTVETQVAALTTSVDALTDAVNVEKTTLDTAVADSVTAKDAAETSAAAAAADRVQTGQDVTATAEDRVQTGQDAAGALNSATAAAASATAAATATAGIGAIKLNANSIISDFSIGAGFNALSVGPISIAAGITVDVADGGCWVIL